MSVAGKRASLSSKNRTVPILRCLLFTHLLPPLTIFFDGNGDSSLSSSTTNASVRSNFFASPLVVQSTTSRRNVGLFTMRLGRLKIKSSKLDQTTLIIIIIVLIFYSINFRPTRQFFLIIITI